VRFSRRFESPTTYALSLVQPTVQDHVRLLCRMSSFQRPSGYDSCTLEPVDGVVVFCSMV